MSIGTKKLRLYVGAQGKEESKDQDTKERRIRKKKEKRTVSDSAMMAFLGVAL